MAVELFIQHNSTIQFPVVEEGARLTLERKGTPGKLEFTVVKGPGLNFAEGDPVKLTVNGTAMFYGFVFKKKRDKGGTIDVVAYERSAVFQRKDYPLRVGRGAQKGATINSDILYAGRWGC